jgi:hypothetical protein
MDLAVPPKHSTWPSFWARVARVIILDTPGIDIAVAHKYRLGNSRMACIDPALFTPAAPNEWDDQDKCCRVGQDGQLGKAAERVFLSSKSVWRKS